jgi:hypothetical protein
MIPEKCGLSARDFFREKPETADLHGRDRSFLIFPERNR